MRSVQYSTLAFIKNGPECVDGKRTNSLSQFPALMNAEAVSGSTMISKADVDTGQQRLACSKLPPVNDAFGGVEGHFEAVAPLDGDVDGDLDGISVRLQEPGGVAARLSG